MAQYDGSIRINTQLNTRDFERGSRSLISGVERLGGSINKIMGRLGFALGIAGFVAFGKQAIKTASDVQEVQNVVDTAFGSMSYKMEEFAKTSVKQFGLSQLSAKEMGSTFMAMASNMVGSAETASDMAINLTKRAADMASFYNKSAKDTATALHGVFTGETEVLKQYGIVQTEVNLQEYAAAHGINKKISAMTQAEKVQLRYNYVMEQTSLAAGDFARTSGNWANQTRILSEQFKELSGTLGSGLIIVLNPVVKSLNTILTQLIAIAKQAGAILTKLFGITVPVAQSGKIAENLSTAVGGADELTESIKEAGKAAKKSLSSLDKLNVLSQDKDDGSSGNGVSASGGFELPDLEIDETGVEQVGTMSNAIDNLLEKLKSLYDWFVKLKNLFFEGFFDGLGESWKERVANTEESARNIVKTLTEIFTNSSVAASAQIMIEKIAYALGQVTGSFASIGIAITQNIISGIDMYLTQNKEFLKEKLVSIFDITGDIALLIGKACTTIAYIFEAFGSENGQQLTANIIGIFNNTIMSLLELALKFGRDILNYIIQPIVNNKDALKKALVGLLGVFVDVSGTILNGINKTLAKINEIYDKYFKPFFDSVATGLSDLLAHFMDFWNGYMQPILDSWAERFDKLWTEHIQPMINNFLEMLGALVEGITIFWENVLQPLLAWIIDVFAPTIAHICDIIFGVVETIVIYITDLIDGIVTTVKGMIDILVGIAQGDWVRVWDGFADVVFGIADVIKSIANTIISIVEGMVNAVVAAINTVIRAINTINFTIPDWIPGVGGKSVGFNIPEINKVSFPHFTFESKMPYSAMPQMAALSRLEFPGYATGQVIPTSMKKHLAWLGDNPRETEVVSPLSTIRQASKEATLEVLSEFGLTGINGRSAGNETFVFQVDGKTFFEITRGEAQRYFSRTGKSPYPT